MSQNECYITLKDHKDNFQNNPKVRLINPAKSYIGQISKEYLQEINDQILIITKLNQWKSTNELIQWYEEINNKSRGSLLQLDIVDFYPSISENLLNNALEFAKNIIKINEETISVIKNARKTLLFNNGTAWQKNTGLSDVTQGGLDSCQVCELVGLFLLHQMRDKFPMLNFGLYRDDGLAYHKRMPGPSLDRIRKEIIKLFQDNGLKITIETSMKTVDFLDVTLNLINEDYKPYKKPNDKLLYVNNQSNHPKTVLKHIPKSVSERLSNISSSKKIFEEAKGEYMRALSASGYSEELIYTEKDKTNTTRRNRKRKILWYNPPFNDSLRTDFGRKFLNLLKKHFPRDHKLHPIINKNNVKLSYSTTKNMKRIVQNHNQMILKNTIEEENLHNCSCPKTKKDQCPLQNRCLEKCIVYKATVTKSNKFYIGITESEFKKRLANHKHSFRHESAKQSTTLSQHIWDIQDNPEPDIKWEIVKSVNPRPAGAKECQLCLEEKLQILKYSKDPNCLNKRSELSQRCITFHRAKNKLTNF